ATVLAAIAAMVGTQPHVFLLSSVVRGPLIAAAIVGLAILTCLPGVAACAMTSRRFGASPGACTAVTLCGIGTAGMVSFWAFLLNPRVGQVTSLAVLVSAAIVVGVKGRCAVPSVLVVIGAL